MFGSIRVIPVEPKTPLEFFSNAMGLISFPEIYLLL